MLRRNVGIKVPAFNNCIYGLTKGQYSPTSEFIREVETKSARFGSGFSPINPLALALGAEATFVARNVDVMQQHLKETLKKAAAHKGGAYVEILQNCNIFNDGAQQYLTEKDGAHRAHRESRARQATDLWQEPRQGHTPEWTRSRSGSKLGKWRFRARSAHPRRTVSQSGLRVFAGLKDGRDAWFPDTHWRASFLEQHVQRYEDIMANQVNDVTAKRGAGDLDKLLRSGDTWEVQAKALLLLKRFRKISGN